MENVGSLRSALTSTHKTYKKAKKKKTITPRSTAFLKLKMETILRCQDKVDKERIEVEASVVRELCLDQVFHHFHLYFCQATKLKLIVASRWRW